MEIQPFKKTIRDCTSSTLHMASSMSADGLLCSS